MDRLAEMYEAEERADANRRAIGTVPEVLRAPDAARQLYAIWEAAHADLMRELEAEAEA